MVKTRSKLEVSAVFHKKSKKGASDENEVVQVALKAVEQAKRSAESSPDNAPSRKRSAFGDITNATLEFQFGKGGKKKHTTTGVTRKESQRKGKPNVTCNKGKSKRTPNEEKEPLESNPETTEEKDKLPSGQFICSPTDSLEESVASFQESLQSTSSGEEKEESQNQQEEEKVEESADSLVIDIDADVSDPFTVSEYANEIFVNMKSREELFSLSNYMETRKDIAPQMRSILVDWLVEVQECFELYHETLYLGVKLLDHFLENTVIQKDELQLVGATALIISSKIEERHPPCMDDFIYICDDAYKQHQFIAMESRIMRSLGFDINIPIPYRFLRRYAKAAFANIETLTLARFLLESSLLESRFITCRASHIAASCLYLALLMKDCNEWTPTLVHYTGYKKDELRDCVLHLNEMNAAPPHKNLMTIRNKYSHKVFHEVAKIPALDVLTIQDKI
ncbi:G2/mitotic-specific cyclin-B3-like isoform X2 [Acropora palmata]|uniref:G2/mitotic-specific cyclin-B3-like isoform X2 n=1 Tax=Acropora palmata TaxID=6131 RepID=UPI003DA1792B